MPSKKFKGKTCAYCGTPAASTTADHVFAKQFFLERHRANLPTVPACGDCNNQKSKLETYLLQIMPLGANHADGQETWKELMPKRAAHPSNKVLKEILKRPEETVELLDLTGQGHEHIPVYIDADMLQDWCKMLARGLTFFHWELTTVGYNVELVPPAANVESEIMAVARRPDSGQYVEEFIGNRAFAYRGFKSDGVRPAIMWMIYLYGSMPIGGDMAVSNACAKSWAVFFTEDEPAEIII